MAYTVINRKRLCFQQVEEKFLKLLTPTSMLEAGINLQLSNKHAHGNRYAHLIDILSHSHSLQKKRLTKRQREVIGYFSKIKQIYLGLERWLSG